MKDMFATRRKQTFRAVCLLLAGICLPTAVPAANIDYGKITSSEQAFKQYWQLTDEEAKRYNLYMEAAGKFRHKDVNPLTVLSMIADTQEDKAYYAKKAAEYEHNMVMREIETSWLVSEAMSENYLADAMQAFTDKLTGIDTLGYQPDERSTDWQSGDSMVILLDQQCLSLKCLSQFADVVKHTPEGVSRSVILRGKDPLAPDAEDFAASWPHVSIHRYDPIEHHYLDSIRANQALHIRDDSVVRTLPINIEEEGESS